MSVLPMLPKELEPGAYYGTIYDTKGEVVSKGFTVNARGEKIFDEDREAMANKPTDIKRGIKLVLFCGDVGAETYPDEMITTQINGNNRSSIVLVYKDEQSVSIKPKGGDNGEIRMETGITKVFCPGIEFKLSDGRYGLVFVTI